MTKDLLNSQVVIAIGDVVVSSRKNSLKTCQRIAKNLLKDINVKDYLHSHRQNTLSRAITGVG